eukprot:2649071-Rhodomonas_salina.1
MTPFSSDPPGSLCPPFPLPGNGSDCLVRIWLPEVENCGRNNKSSRLPHSDRLVELVADLYIRASAMSNVSICGQEARREKGSHEEHIHRSFSQTIPTAVHACTFTPQTSVRRKESQTQIRGQRT